MDKKWIVVLCIIILLTVGLFAFYSFTNQGNEVKVGNAIFQIPNGYHISDSNTKNVTNLTNGTNNIYIMEYNGKDVQKHIDLYINSSEKNNRSVTISNFTVGKTLVYKSNLNTSSAVHYWFVKNKNTYTIYTWDKNPEIDSIATKLIETIS